MREEDPEAVLIVAHGRGFLAEAVGLLGHREGTILEFRAVKGVARA